MFPLNVVESTTFFPGRLRQLLDSPCKLAQSR
jgi:hypothetical protein